ncbi:hypothetical protein Mal4_58250 [Maioricimonas rarisocia]|uniref:Uncharacterized protein n=1 Tax=Maioricimonas rarisocia TaxID=2528026 RepID=A0A517ZG47_9PLAN|nr:hypothetical protein [Maioricimonas rarisocia]QDU41457.1 hypothetical protein Mal4_58250 [Maioricimonas rarisocia]
MNDSHVSRRDFARQAALATGGLLAASAGTARGDDETRPERAEQRPPGPGGPFRPPEVEDFLMMALLQEFPSDHLSDEQLGGIRAGITGNRRRAERMRRYTLENGDGPATMFRALRKA